MILWCFLTGEGEGQKGNGCDNNACCGFKLHLNVYDKTVYVMHCNFLESNYFNCNWVQKRCSKLYIIKNMRTTPTDTPDTLGAGMSHTVTGLFLWNPSPVRWRKSTCVVDQASRFGFSLMVYDTGLFRRSSGTSFSTSSRLENND